MEIFINELSLHGQYYDQAAFVEAIRELVNIFSFLNNNKTTTKLYKPENQVFINRKTIQNEYFQQSFEGIRNKQLKEAFRGIIFAKLNPKDWQVEQLHDTQDIFVCPIIDDFVSNTTLAEVAERNLQKPDIQRLVINFMGSCFQNLRQIEIFKNDENIENPIYLACLDSRIDFENWLQQTVIDRESYLKNVLLFEKTNYQVQGKTIYKHKSTNNYWYLDNLHKTHFEVFNAQKEHLGEADLEGDLQPDSNDAKKNGKLPF